MRARGRLEYFGGLELPSYNELFDAEDEAFYLDTSCATRRFFKALAKEHYSYVPNVICDANQGLRRMGGGITAFRALERRGIRKLDRLRHSQHA